jgi:DNA polymerase-3 subunit alpha/DNA polymerase-3 subunit epsilon
MVKFLDPYKEITLLHSKMVRLLFFDTETTGLPKHSAISALQLKENWPDLVSICWIIVDDGVRVKKEYHIIKPEGWTVPAAASKIHGITQEKAVLEGKSLADVLEVFRQDCATADFLVAHNLFFDRNVVFNAYAWRLNIGPTGFWKNGKELCTMLKSTNELRIPSRYGKAKDMYKYPSLDELYRATFLKDPPGSAHSADRDVEVLQEIFFARWGAVGGVTV